MDWFVSLYSWFGRLALKLWGISDKIRAWSILPGVDWIADRFDDAAVIAADIMDFLIEAYHWTQDRLDELEEFVSQDWVQEWLRNPLGELAQVWGWFTDWAGNVRDTIGEWWEGIKSTIQDLIDAATEGLDDLIGAWDSFWQDTWPDWLSSFDNLRAAWDNFWTETLPTLVDNISLEEWRKGLILDIDDLIIGKLKEWFPFYDTLVELWEDITEFFSDPLEWLWTGFTNWFLGKEV